MNNNELEQLILLKQSGEITPDQLARLNTVLSGQATAQEWAGTLDRITSLARTPDEATAMPAFVRERILHEARMLQQTEGRQPVRSPRRTFRWQWAAALMALLVLPWVFWPNSDSSHRANHISTSATHSLHDAALVKIMDDGLSGELEWIDLNLLADLSTASEMDIAMNEEDDLLNLMASTLLVDQM